YHDGPEGNAKQFHSIGIVGAIITFLFSAWAWNGGGVSLHTKLNWLPSLGISYALGADGLSLTMVILTTFLMLMAVIASFSSITKRLKLYYTLLFILTTALLGVFTARDAFLFFLFYELELIPMYLLIAIWGGANRQYAATKFVLYTLFGSVFMLAGILGAYWIVLKQGGINPSELFLFDTLKENLPHAALGAQLAVFIPLFIGFAVKLPVVPVHTWLPDAHTEAPTPVSMLLAGILLKMGGYGMVRLCYEWLPGAAVAVGPWVGLLAVINIVYTASVALVQTDLKKLIAYSSVSHMGFVLLGLAALNPAGFNGAVFVMFAHGIVSAGLFMCVGVVYLRTHTRQIADMTGLATPMPAVFFFFLFISMASLGLPFLISFASETLVFYGAFTSNAFQWAGSVLGAPIHWNMQVVTSLSALGVVIGAAYLLWMLKRIFFGNVNTQWAQLNDLSFSEVIVLSSLAVLIVMYGFQPLQLTQRFEPWVTAMALPYQSLNSATNTPPSPPPLTMMGVDQP
ncbi:MAG: NADH-quinone oxidoreductase subunit M, partial [Vampirovibrionales bacterium]